MLSLNDNFTAIWEAAMPQTLWLLLRWEQTRQGVNIKFSSACQGINRCNRNCVQVGRRRVQTSEWPCVLAVCQGLNKICRYIFFTSLLWCYSKLQSNLLLLLRALSTSQSCVEWWWQRNQPQTKGKNRLFHLLLTAVLMKCSAESFQMALPFPLSKFLKSLKVNLSSMCDMNNEMLLNVNFIK